MVSIVKKNKKSRKNIQKAKNVGGSFEIPVYVVEKNVRPTAAPMTKGQPTEIQTRKNRTSGFKIVKDENDLPVFEKIAEQGLPVKNQKKEAVAAADVAKNVPVATAGQKFAVESPSSKIKKEKPVKKFLSPHLSRYPVPTSQNCGDEGIKYLSRGIKCPAGRWGDLSVKNDKKKEKRQKIFVGLSEKSKTRILWTSVAIIACLIFFVWLSFLKENFSFNFNSKNSQNLSITNDAGNALGDLKNQWNNLQSGWSNFGNILKQRTSANASQEVVDKLKEKVLVEEMKDKISNSSTQGGSAPGGQFPISNEKTE